jgi:hypothetical protein
MAAHVMFRLGKNILFLGSKVCPFQMDENSDRISSEIHALSLNIEEKYSSILCMNIESKTLQAQLYYHYLTENWRGKIIVHSVNSRSVKMWIQGRREAINIGGGGGCHHVLTNIF